MSKTNHGQSGILLCAQDFSIRPYIVPKVKRFTSWPTPLTQPAWAQVSDSLPTAWQHPVIFHVPSLIHVSGVLLHFPVSGIQFLPSLFSGLGLAFLFRGLWILFFLGFFSSCIGCAIPIFEGHQCQIVFFSLNILRSLIKFLQKLFWQSGLTERPGPIAWMSPRKIHFTHFRA